MSKSEKIFKEAVEVMPGGVNSPVRAFASVGGTPRFIKSANGAKIVDVDENEYIDYIGSWGPMILGHNNIEIKNAVKEAVENGLSFGGATQIEVEMAKLICDIVPSIEMVRMVNSGTEAVMSAIRVARGYTKKDKIIKFEGCYHGHCDAMLVKAGSGLMTDGIPDSAGVPKGCAMDTLTAKYNNIESVKELFENNKDNIAAVIIEPVAANMGVVTPKENFLKQLRELCDKYNSLLIFDEVITGFRLGLGGAQGLYSITPDLTTFGKIVGAGMPVGAYGGKKEIMKCVSPVGSVYQAGTLSGNPIAMSAGICQLRILLENKHIYDNINAKGEMLRKGMKEILSKHSLPYQVTGVGSLSCLFFTEKSVIDYETAKTSDTKIFAKYFNEMLKQGIYLAPSQFEAIFMSNAHTDEMIEKTLCAMDKTFSII